MLHLRSCSLIAEDITSTRSDSFLMRSVSPAKKSSALYHRDDGSVHKESHKTTPPPGCPFCGKAPLSKSGLSAHLLSCQKKKELKERREAHVASTISAQSISEKRNTPQRMNIHRTPSPAIQKSSRGLDKSSNRGSSVTHVSRFEPTLKLCR